MTTITKDNKAIFALARSVAQRSPDTSRKTGVVIFTKDEALLTACNELTSGVEVTPERLERPAKYLYTEHAERNAIYTAAAAGTRLKGSTFWLPWFPCVECARAIVQVGAVELICTEPDWSEVRYNFRDAETILQKGHVTITFVNEDGSCS